MPVILMSDFETYVDTDGIERGRRRQVESQYPWVGAGLIQGGTKGIVFSRKGNYVTAFVEVSIDGTFIRGEGADVTEAETSAWNQYQQRVNCPGHEWTTRSYTNGAGFCKHCGTFGVKVFTGEDLGQFCDVCGVGTTWGNHVDEDTKVVKWFCEEHYVRVPYDWELEEDLFL